MPKATNKIPGMSLQAEVKGDWYKIVKRAWSFRMIALTAFLSMLELAVLTFGAGWFPPGIFLGLSFITSILAGVARVMPQVNMDDVE